MKNIVLVGLPGSGKTTLGSLLSEKTGLPFLDLDAEIEKTEGQSIQEIFHTRGETGFRDLETAAVRKISAKRGIILATGGGTILRDENMKLLSDNGLIIFIDRPVEAIQNDIQIAERPLLKNDPLALGKLAETRRSRYLFHSDYTLDNRSDSSEAMEILLTAYSALNAKDYAVIGDPISHSLSPQIHGAAFSAQGVAAEYTTIRVSKDSLPMFTAAVRKSGLRGFNVTLPHKQSILPLLDEVAFEARLCGAVNTVAVRDGRLYGYNTDMEGLNLSLGRTGCDFTGRKLLILGAGGAARAAALKAGLEKAESIHIAARDLTKAKALAGHIIASTGTAATFGGWDRNDLEKVCKSCDILINATPLGMTGFEGTFEDLSFLTALPQHAIVCDLIYSPPETVLLKAAQALGLNVQNGFGMLIFQALLAQELFLDRQLNKPFLFRTITENLSRLRKEMDI